MPSYPPTIPSHTYEPTTDKNIFRFVDREGNWTHYWIKSKRMFVPAVNHIIRTGYPKGERFYAYLLHTDPHEAARKLATSGEEGARTHDAIRDLINGELINIYTKYFHEISKTYEVLSLEEWKNIQAFAAWSEKYNPEKIIFEFTVWSEEHLYAGTVDFVGTIVIPDKDKSMPQELWGKRILILLDWKTSSGIWDDYELQIAAYRQALLEKYRQILPLAQFGTLWTGIVRLGTSHKSGFEMKIWSGEETDINFRFFCAAKKIYEKKEGEQFEPTIEHMPTEIRLVIPSHIEKQPNPQKKPKKKRQKKK